ncbi:Cinnamoyl-CoA reductase [Bertholletia excelsa]
MDLLDYGSIFAAVSGAAGVFHLASPVIVGPVQDLERELLAPAIEGTKNVLRAAKESEVRRVVVTSSVSAITPSRHWPADKVKDENCWTDVDYCKQNGLWYSVSKTLAEKAAWEFAKEHGLDMVVVIPGTVMGPILPPTFNASMLMLLLLLQGCTESYEDVFMGSVHVKDVALAHILLYENTSATGRHLCVEAISHYGDFAAKVAELYPEYKIPSPFFVEKIIDSKHKRNLRLVINILSLKKLNKSFRVKFEDNSSTAQVPSHLEALPKF